jgi:D-inositol-3-phosphate glycosyltransferase
MLVDGHKPSHWADALEALYDDPRTRDDMGRAAAVHAESFGWPRTAAITLESYHASVPSLLVPVSAVPGDLGPGVAVSGDLVPGVRDA